MKNHIRFDLEKYKNIYFKNVYTVTKDEFQNDFVQKWEAL